MFSIVGCTASVRMRSAATRTSSPTRIPRPKIWRPLRYVASAPVPRSRSRATPTTVSANARDQDANGDPLERPRDVSMGCTRFSLPHLSAEGKRERRIAQRHDRGRTPNVGLRPTSPRPPRRAFSIPLANRCRWRRLGIRAFGETVLLRFRIESSGWLVAWR